MAVRPTNTAQAVWHHLAAERSGIIHNLEILPEPERRLEDRLAIIEDQLLLTPSPSLAGTLLKLRLLWSEKLDGDDIESKQRRLIVAELEAACSSS